MTPRQRLTLGIADTLLAGPADDSARARCEHALASRMGWIGRLTAEIAAKFADRWRDNDRTLIAQAISESVHFDRGWRSARPPRLRAYALTSSKMTPLPPALLDCVIPNLPTPADIARWLDLTTAELDWWTGPLTHPRCGDASVKHYNTRWITKRSGGMRLIEMPKARLRNMQRRLLPGLLEYVPPHEAVHGFRPRHSCVTNAQPHVGQDVVMRIDLENFFATVGGGRVYQFFSALGYPLAAARVLTRLTTCATPLALLHQDAPCDWIMKKRLASPHLPQGAPTSPALANLCAFNFDVRVQALAKAFGARYTRYADDLVFSGGDLLAKRSRTFEAHVGAIALEEGFRVNHRKTRVMRATTRQIVTGIVVNTKPNPPREQFDRIKAMLHNCLRHGPQSQTQSGVPQMRNHLAGHIAHIGAINPNRGARLRKLFDAIHW